MGSDTKMILLRVARDIIDKKGINEISMRTVGSAAHLSRGALYRHFENKESLLAAIVIENFNRINNTITEIEKMTAHPVKCLFEVCIAYYDFGIGNPDHYQLMFNTGWDEDTYPEIRQAAFAVFERVMLLVSRAFKSKQVSKKVLLEKTAIIYAFIHGIVELHLAGHNKSEKGLEDIKSLVHHIIESVISK